MKIAVLGAGAMGCLYGAYLSTDNEVIMIDTNPDRVETINNEGIVVVEEDGTNREFKNVRAFVSGECTEKAELVIVFVKTLRTEDALRMNRKIFSENTIVMTLQNGSGNDRKMEKYFDKRKVVVGTSKHNSTVLGPNTVRHSGHGVTTIGSNVGNKKNPAAIKEVLVKAGFDTEVSDDIKRIIWSKLFVNLSINTFTAITRSPIGYMIENDYAWDFAEKLICEAVDVAAADGTNFSYREVLNMVHFVCEDAGKGYSSMSQDVMHFRLTEVDNINGAIVEQARHYNVAAPYNALVVDLVHAIEGAYKYHEEQAKASE